jgi:hypothetical protein
MEYLEEIKKFCGICDKYNLKNGRCNDIFLDNQKRYVERDFCGWARIDGQRAWVSSLYAVIYKSGKEKVFLRDEETGMLENSS